LYRSRKVVQDYRVPGVVQVYRSSVIGVKVYYRGTGVVQGYRSSTVVYGFLSITWVQMLYRSTELVQYFSVPVDVKGYRSSGVLQGYTGTGLIQLCWGSTGV